MLDSPKLSLSQMSSTSLQTRNALNQEAPSPLAFALPRWNSVRNMATGRGTSSAASWRVSALMSAIICRDDAVTIGLSYLLGEVESR